MSIYLVGKVVFKVFKDVFVKSFVVELLVKRYDYKIFQKRMIYEKLNDEF